jgi:hypothetical protein
MRSTQILNNLSNKLADTTEDRRMKQNVVYNVQNITQIRPILSFTAVQSSEKIHSHDTRGHEK